MNGNGLGTQGLTILAGGYDAAGAQSAVAKTKSSRPHTLGNVYNDGRTQAIAGNHYYGSITVSGAANIHLGDEYILDDLERLDRLISKKPRFQELGPYISRLREDFRQQKDSLMESLARLYSAAGVKIDRADLHKTAAKLLESEDYDARVQRYLGDRYDEFINLLGLLHETLQTFQDHTSSWRQVEARYGDPDPVWLEPLLADNLARKRACLRASSTSPTASSVLVSEEDARTSNEKQQIIDEAMTSLKEALEHAEQSVNRASGISSQLGIRMDDTMSAMTEDSDSTERRLHIEILNSRYGFLGNAFALLDTGCTDTCISERLQKELGLAVKECNDRNYTLPNGQRFPIVGKVKLVLLWVDTKQTWRHYPSKSGGIYVFVVDMQDEDVILSNHFTSQPGAVDASEVINVDEHRLNKTRLGHRRRRDRPGEEAAERQQEQENRVAEDATAKRERQELLARLGISNQDADADDENGSATTTTTTTTTTQTSGSSAGT